MNGEPIVSREADGEDWFKRLCERHGLVPAEPKTAQEVVAGDVLFDVMGWPRPVIAVRAHKGWVRIIHPDGKHTNWDNGTRVTLIARRPASTQPQGGNQQ